VADTNRVIEPEWVSFIASAALPDGTPASVEVVFNRAEFDRMVAEHASVMLRDRVRR
jgi:hypothetical protein